MKAVLLVVALAGCTTYAHRSMHNAPGLVDLDTPPARESGDPAAYEPPRAPGSETYVLFVAPSFLLGKGRLDTGQAAGEVDLTLRLERTVDPDGALLHRSAFAISAGVGFAQFSDTRPTIFGATFVELNYRSFLKVIPFDVGLGAALYPGATIPSTMEHYGTDVGGQLSLRLPLLHVRARVMAETGFEIMAGYEVPIPFFFGRSR